jgi:hypothetical protein
MQRTIALSTALVFATLMLLIAIPGNSPATAGESMPNVTGKWEGSWSVGLLPGRASGGGSGQITLNLLQEGTKVIGKQNVVDLISLTPGMQTIPVSEEIRDGEIDDSTLHFHVSAETLDGRINFTLTVSGNSMTGTACATYCAKLKLKKALM